MRYYRQQKTVELNELSVLGTTPVRTKCEGAVDKTKVNRSIIIKHSMWEH